MYIYLTLELGLDLMRRLWNEAKWRILHTVSINYFINLIYLEGEEFGKVCCIRGNEE